MLICAYTDKEYRDSRINYWKDIYGFKMETMTTEIITEAIIAFADEHKVFSDSFNFKVRVLKFSKYIRFEIM
jgi:hypothetical protein